MKQIRIFTDGACSGNPGPGGWAAVFVIDDKHRILRGGESNTTNNRMELIAVVESLKKIKSSKKVSDREYIISSDSAYVINTIKQNWLRKWADNNWMTAKDEPVKNLDLWKECLQLMDLLERTGINISYCKVKGHAGHPLNELADQIARAESVKASESKAQEE